MLSPWLSWSCLLFFVWVQLGLPYYRTSANVLGAQVQLVPAEIIALTNLERQQEGMTPLKPNNALEQAAQAKAQDMIKVGYWDHISPSKTPPWKFILDAKYDYRYAGENLAKDYYTSQALMKGWMDSPAHKANILNTNYQEIGIAIIEGNLNDKQTVLVVQMFGTQYTPQDYIEAKNQQEMAEVFTTSELIQPSFWESVLASNFLVAKIVSLAVVVVLLSKVIWSAVKFFVSPQKREISKTHWGHFLFLLAIGTLIMMTRDGDVLGLF